MRHRRRSVLTSMIIVATMALLTCFQGLSDGGHRAMVDIGIRLGLGHLLIAGSGYAQNPSLDRLVDRADVLVGQAREMAGANATHAVSRLRLSAMAQAGPQQVAITVSGVQPGVEEQVSVIAAESSLIEGETLSSAMSRRSQGSLAPIVLGDRLARSLGVRVTDRVTLTVKPREGTGFARAAFEVAGVFRTGMHEFDALWAEVPLDAAQSLAGVGDDVSQIAIYLDDARSLPGAVASLAPLAGQQGLELQPWYQVAPELNSAVALDAAGMKLLMVIVVVVVVAGILNTVVMSSQERRREFGVMLALGAHGGLITRAVLLEAIYLATVSVAIGMVLGYGGHRYFASVGLDFKEIFGTSLQAGGVLLPERFHSWLDPALLSGVAVLVLALTVVVSMLPAVGSSRLDPIQAIRHHV